MTKNYGLIWGKTLYAWVAVAKIAKALIARSAGRTDNDPAAGVPTWPALCSLVLVMTLAAQSTAHADPSKTVAPNQLPTGGQLAAGQASVTQSNNTLTVNQASNRAAIDWQTFNVGASATVNFNQPSATSVTLNRVLDSNPSQIFGRISANGQVFLTNPNGVYFAPGARADVGALVATTHRISLDDFMAGKVRFERNGATGSVVNQGELQAALGGYIAMLAPEVRNQGVLIAQMGTVALAAGEVFELQFDANKSLAGLRVTPTRLRALVENGNVVLAPGGLVILSAQAMDSLQGGVVRNTGRIEATGMSNRAGRIVLEASDRAENAGVLNVSASATGAAGRVELSAPAVINSGSILATGSPERAAGGAVQVTAANFTQTSAGVVDVSAPWLGGELLVRASAGIELNGGVNAAATDESTTARGGQVDLRSGGNLSVDGAGVDASGVTGGTVYGEAGATGPTRWPVPEQPIPGRGYLALLGNTVVSSRSRSGSGGNITLLGEHILLNDNTRLDATGNLGGGYVRIGGDWQGSGSYRQATTVFMNSGVIIDVSATEKGAGGTVVLWSDVANTASVTSAQGTILAKGGAQGGKGGRVETSGFGLNIESARVSTLAADGSAGDWLLDPGNINIVDSGDVTSIGNSYTAPNAVNITPTAVLNALASNNVTITTGTGGEYSLTVSSPIQYTGSTERTLTLGATERLNVNAAITSTHAPLNLVLASEIDRTGSDSFTNSGYGVGIGANISTNGGDLWIGGGALTGTWTGSRGSRTVGVGAAMGGAGNWIGIEFFNGSAVTTNGGSVRLVGTSGRPDGSSSDSGIAAYQSSATIDVGSGNVELVTDRPNFDYEASNTHVLQLSGSGTFSLIPLGNSFASDIVWNSTKSSGYYTSTGDVDTLGGLKIQDTFGITLGRSTSTTNKDITVHQPIAVSGAINLFGGSLWLNESLSTGSSGAAILLKAPGFIQLASGKSLTTTGGNITVWSDVDINLDGGIKLLGSNSITSGGGKVTLAGGADDGNGIPSGFAYGATGSHGVLISSSTISSGNGDIVIRGVSATGTTNDVDGVRITQGSTINSGTGAILIHGKTRNDGNSAYAAGVRVNSTANTITSANTTSNAVTITGDASGFTGTAGQAVDGVIFENGDTVSATGSGGGITISGIGKSGSGYGARFLTGPKVLANGGAIDITGQSGSTGLYFGGANLGFAASSTVPASSSAITLTADSFGFASTPVIRSTGALTIQSYGNSFSSAFSTAGLTLGSTLSGLTLGRTTNTANVTIGSATSIAGPIGIYGGNVYLNEGLTSTLASAGVLVNASGTISLADSKSITTSGGSVVLNSDRDDSSGGAVLLKNNTSITTSGGAIAIGGGSAGNASGNAIGNTTNQVSGRQVGVHFGTLDAPGSSANISLNSGGGNISIRGRGSADTSTTDNQIGVMISAGTSINSGTGTLTIAGYGTGGNTSGSGHGIDFAWTDGTTGITLQSANTTSSAISITGDASGSLKSDRFGIQEYFGSDKNQIAATGAGGGITITGVQNGSTTNKSISLSNFSVLAASGTITIHGGVNGFESKNGVGQNGTVELGFSASTGSLVTSSSSNIVLTGDTLVAGGTGLAINSTGSLTIQPSSNSFTSAFTWPVSGITLGSISGLTLGKSTNTADITIGSATSIAGPISIYGGNVYLNAGLTTTDTTTGNISIDASALSGSGDITLANGRTLTVTQSANSTYGGVISGTGSAVTKAGTGTLTISGTHSYTGATTVSAGGLTTSGADQISDGSAVMVVSGATLTMGGSDTVASISGGGNIVNPYTLTVGGDSNSTSFTGVISGIGGVTKSGSGTLTLSGTNTYTGATTVSAGGLATSGADKISDSSAVSISSGATLTLGGAETVGSIAGSGSIVNGGYLLTAGGDNSSTSYTGVMSGAGGFTKAGSGSLTLSGANTYTGITTISAGTLSVSSLANGGSSSNIGASSNAAVSLVFNGGTLAYTGAAQSTDRLFTLGVGGGTIDNSGSGALNFTNSGTLGLSGTGARRLTLAGTNTGNNSLAMVVPDDGSSNATSLVKSGAGSWLLAGSNTYSGTTSVSAGTLAISNATGLGTSVGGTTLTSSATLDLQGVVVGAEAITINGGTLKASVGTSGLSGAFSMGASSTVEVSGTQLTLSGVVSGAGFDLTKTGSGTLVLGDANTYTGATTINGGTLALSGGGSIASSSGVASSGAGVFDVSATTSGATITTLGGSSSAGTGVVLGSKTLTLSNASGTYSGVIGGTGGGLTLTAGTQTLSGANTYTGITTVNGGTLALSGSGSIASSSGVASSGAGVFDVSATTSGATITTLDGSSSAATGVVLGSKTLTLSNASGTYSGVIGGTGGGLTLTAGTETLSGANTYTGITTINGGTLAIGNATGLGTTAGNTTVASGATLDLQGVALGAEAVTLNGGTLKTSLGTSSLGGSISLGASSTVDVGGALLTLTGSVSGTGFGLTKTGVGTLALLGSNTYDSGTIVSAGIVKVGSATALGSGAVSVSSGAAVDLNGQTMTSTGGMTLNGTGVSSGGALLNSSTTPATYAGLVSLGSASSIHADSGNISLSHTGAITGSGFGLTLGGASGGTIASVIHTGAGTLNKEGAGTWTLSGANTYTGATTVSAGTLAISNATGLGTTAGGTAVASSATLDLQGVAVGAEAITLNGGTLKTSVGASSLSGTVGMGASSTVDVGGSQLTLTGVVSGTGYDLTKTGAGVLVLSGANTYSGTSTIAAGALVLQNDAPAPGSKAFAGSGTLRIEPVGTSFASGFSTSGWTFGSNLTGLTIGKSGNTAGITVASAISVAGPIAVYGGDISIGASLAATTGGGRITLASSGTITQTAALSASELLIDQGSVTLENTGNVIGTLAARSVGLFNFVNASAMTVGGVNGTNGIGATGTVNISTRSGDLTISQNIATTASALTLNAGASNGAGTSTGGDIKLSGSPTLTVSSAGLIKLFTGSVSGSSGVTTLVGSGTGRFRYNAVSGTDFSTGLRTALGGSGTYAIYREQPAVTGTVSSSTITYGDATPAFSLGGGAGLVNGDNALFAVQSGSSSTAGFLKANTYNVNTSNLTGLGYDVSGVTAGSLIVNKKALDISITGLSAANKVYDATTSTTVAGSETVTGGGSISGDGKYLNNDVVSLSGSKTGTFDNKNVGTSKTVTVGGLALAGTDKENYILNAVTTTADITAKALTVSGLSSANKVYDSYTAAVVQGTATLQAAIAAGTGTSSDGKPYTGDTLSVNGTAVGNFNSHNVTNATHVIFSGLSLGGASSGNYTLTPHSDDTSARITPKTVSLSATKPYDATTSLTGVVSLSTGVGSETLSYSGAVASDKHVATANKYISALTLGDATDGSGGLASNYQLPNMTVAAAGVNTVSITARTLTPTLSNTGVTKVYDGTTKAPSGFSPTYSFSGLVSGDTDASLSATSMAFNNPNVANASTLTVAGLSIGGITGNNGSYPSDYALSSSSLQVNATIVKANLTATANNDARFLTGSDAGSYGGVSLSGFVNGETLSTITGYVAPTVTRTTRGPDGNTTGANSLAGTYTGQLITTGGGADNYTIATRVPGSYTIVPSNQLLVRVANASSTYGSTPQFVISSVEYDNGASVVRLDNGSVALSSVTIDSNNQVTINDGLSGTATFTLAPTTPVLSQGNKLKVGSYQLSVAGAVAENSANFSDKVTVVGALQVNAKGLVASASSISKVYDGTTSMNGVTLGLSTVEANDVVSVNGSGDFSSKNAGNTLGYTLSNLTLVGADAANYYLSTGTAFSGTNGVITQRPLIVSYTAANKVYDGNASATITSSDNRVSGDSLTVSATAAFADKNVGNSKTVSVSGITLSGVDAGNYSLSSTTAQTTANISRLNSVTWVGAATGNWFDPANWAGGAVPDRSNVANVVIPQGVTATFGSSVVSPAQSGSVNIDSLGSTGSLNQSDGTLNIGTGGMTLTGFNQTGGISSNSGPTTVSSFQQSGGSFSGTGAISAGSLIQTGGTLVAAGNLTVNSDFRQAVTGGITVGGNTNITDAAGGVTVGNLNTSGTTTITSTGGSLIQAAGTSLVSVGTTTLTASDAGVAADISLTSTTNNFTGAVSVTAANASLSNSNATTTVLSTTGDTTVSSGGNLVVSGSVSGTGSDLTTTTTAAGSSTTFGATTVGGGLSATTNGGAITQTGALTVTGSSSLNAGTGNITLTDPANGLSGTVNVTGGTTSLSNSNATTTVLSTTGDTTVSSGGNLVVSGSVSGTGSDLTTTTTAAGSSTTFGATTVGGGLSATTNGGAITQTGALTVTGSSSLNAGTGNITLTNAVNDFTGAVSATATNASLTDANALTLGTVKTTGDLTANSNGDLNLGSSTVGGNLRAASGNGDITQSGALVVTGTSNLNAGAGRVTLLNSGNQLSQGVTVQAANNSIAGDSRQTARQPQEIVLGSQPIFVPMGTGLSNATPPQPLGMSTQGSNQVTGTSTPSTSTPSTGAGAAGAIGSANNNAGITIDLRSAIAVNNSMMVSVSLPQGSSTAAGGFSFELPQAIKSMTQTPQAGAPTTSPQASLADGSVLPAWLRFDSQTLRFEASSVPSGAFPLEVVVMVGTQRIVVVIAQKTE
jgi:filamentous hemagglutinin family protein